MAKILKTLNTEGPKQIEGPVPFVLEVGDEKRSPIKAMQTGRSVRTSICANFATGNVHKKTFLEGSYLRKFDILEIAKRYLTQGTRTLGKIDIRIRTINAKNKSGENFIFDSFNILMIFEDQSVTNREIHEAVELFIMELLFNVSYHCNQLLPIVYFYSDKMVTRNLMWENVMLYDSRDDINKITLKDNRVIGSVPMECVLDDGTNKIIAIPVYIGNGNILCDTTLHYNPRNTGILANTVMTSGRIDDTTAMYDPPEGGQPYKVSCFPIASTTQINDNKAMQVFRFFDENATVEPKDSKVNAPIDPSRLNSSNSKKTPQKYTRNKKDGFIPMPIKSSNRDNPITIRMIGNQYEQGAKYWIISLRLEPNGADLLVHTEFSLFITKITKVNSGLGVKDIIPMFEKHLHDSPHNTTAEEMLFTCNKPENLNIESSFIGVVPYTKVNDVDTELLSVGSTCRFGVDVFNNAKSVSSYKKTIVRAVTAAIEHTIVEGRVEWALESEEYASIANYIVPEDIHGLVTTKLFPVILPEVDEYLETLPNFESIKAGNNGKKANKGTNKIIKPETDAESVDVASTAVDNADVSELPSESGNEEEVPSVGSVEVESANGADDVPATVETEEEYARRMQEESIVLEEQTPESDASGEVPIQSLD